MSDLDPAAPTTFQHRTLPSGERVAVLFDEAALARRTEALAQAIVARLGPDFLVVALLKGSVVFLADLLRALHRAGAAPEVDFLTLSSYGAATVSSGAVTVVHDIAGVPAGRAVLIVDDILESGRTLDFARRHLSARGARGVHSCVLLDKPGKRAVPVAPDFLGFAMPDIFVVGYGMDRAHRFRELPFVGALPDRTEEPGT